jgi:NAD(P)-dependent dehydrogenase (short-subunit alcohol dehydrogenase family)
MTQSLDGKIAVITGAASGIGLATTEKLLANGVTVVMVDWNAKALDELAARLGPQAIPQVTNLLDADSSARPCCRRSWPGRPHSTSSIAMPAPTSAATGRHAAEAIDKMLNSTSMR